MCVLVYPRISTSLQNTCHRMDEVKCKQQFFVHTFRDKSAPRRAEKAVTKCITSNCL